MANITIQIGSHGEQITVSEMRKQLAKVLSKLRGDQRIAFAFGASLPNYTPTVVHGELARQENE